LICIQIHQGEIPTILPQLSRGWSPALPPQNRVLPKVRRFVTLDSTMRKLLLDPWPIKRAEP